MSLSKPALRAPTEDEVEDLEVQNNLSEELSMSLRKIEKLKKLLTREAHSNQLLADRCGEAEASLGKATLRVEELELEVEKITQMLKASNSRVQYWETIHE